MILHSHAADDRSAEVVRSQGDKAGSRPSARSEQCPGGCIVQDRPDSEHRMDSGNGVSLTSVCQVGRTTDRNVCYICQQTTNQVCMAISGPPGHSGRTPCPLLGTTGGASFMCSRYSRWSLRSCRRSTSLKAFEAYL